jgi:hypothetical protein
MSLRSYRSWRLWVGGGPLRFSVESPQPGVADLQKNGATGHRHIEVLGFSAALAIAREEHRSRVDLVGKKELDEKVAFQLIDGIFIQILVAANIGVLEDGADKCPRVELPDQR